MICITLMNVAIIYIINSSKIIFILHCTYEYNDDNLRIYFNYSIIHKCNTKI